MTAIDPNSPFIRHLAANNPTLLKQLGFDVPAQAAPLTADAVRSIVDERLAAITTAAAPTQKAQSTMAQFDQVFAKALSHEDYKAFADYVAAGAPGFDEMLKGDALNPLAQLLWEIIKESRK